MKAYVSQKGLIARLILNPIFLSMLSTYNERAVAVSAGLGLYVSVQESRGHGRPIWYTSLILLPHTFISNGVILFEKTERIITENVNKWKDSLS